MTAASKTAVGPMAKMFTDEDDPGSPSAIALLSVVQDTLDQLAARGLRGLAICGVADGDGVSFVAANLAAALARAGLSVLLVDANLRAPRQRSLFPDVGGDSAGLVDVLTGPTADARAVIHSDVRPGLSVLFGGEPRIGAEDTLSQSRFAGLMSEWLRTFEFVVIDTPPANNTPDALRIARLAGCALLVVRRGQTFVSDLSLLVEELRDQDVTIVGSVLNDH